MHELSVCTSLCARIEEIAMQHQVTRVHRVNLLIGALAGIEPRLLQQAFPLASKGTAAATARLHIKTIPVRVQCLDCGADTDCAPNNLLCGYCRSSHTQLLAGDEMLLESIEL